MVGATPTTQAWYDLFNWHKLDDFMPSNFWLVLQYYLWPTWKNVEPHKPLLSQFKCPIHLHMHAIATVASYPRLAPCVLALPPSTCWCSIATVDSLCRSPTQKLMSSCGYPANISNLAGQIFVSAAKQIYIYTHIYLAWQSILASKVILRHLKTLLNHTNDW